MVVVGSHHADTAPRLDRHVAERHPGFHRECRGRRTVEFDGVTGCAADPDPGDQRQDDVLDGNGDGQRPGQGHAHALLLPLAEHLRRQHAFAFARPDAERDGAERAVGAGMTVAAHQGNAGQGEAELGADDVDDAVAPVAERNIGDAEALAVGPQPLDLARGLAVRKRPVAELRRHGMVRHGQVRVGPPHLTCRAARPAKACGLETSWTRCRSM